MAVWRALTKPARYAALVAGVLPVLAFPAPNLEFLAWFALVPGLPTVRAARGELVEPPRRGAHGGVVVRYRPPGVAGPSVDTLEVTTPRGRFTGLMKGKRRA